MRAAPVAYVENPQKKGKSRSQLTIETLGQLDSYPVPYLHPESVLSTTESQGNPFHPKVEETIGKTKSIWVCLLLDPSRMNLGLPFGVPLPQKGYPQKSDHPIECSATLYAMVRYLRQLTVIVPKVTKNRLTLAQVSGSDF